MARKPEKNLNYNFTPSLRGSQIEANYSQQTIDSHCGNPFIEALPPIFEEEYVALKIARYPKYQDEHRKLGKQTRLHLVQEIADYVETLPFHLRVEQRLSRLLRHGYKARNPFSPEFVRQFHIGFDKLLEEGVDDNGVNLAGVRSTANAFAMVGVSGQGKTTAIESSLLLYPQVIHHSQFNGQPFILKQLVWLKLNCPFDGSLKGLCINFFQAVDSVIGTKYFQKFVSNGRNSVDVLIPIMAQIASLHGLGVLVIDEIQNLSTMKSGGAEQMLNYFTQLINTIGVPVIAIGTFKAMKILSGSFSQARRSTGQGDVIIDRLIEGEEWSYFIERLWRYQWTAKKTALNDPLKKAMYELSQGIIDIAVKLYMLAQWEAIGESEQISVSLLKHVAKRDMQLVQPILKLMKQNKKEALLLVDDLYPKWDVFNEFLERSKEKVNLEGEIRKQIYKEEKVKQDHDKYMDLVKTAVEFGAPLDVAEQIAKQVIKEHEVEQDLVFLKRAVVNAIPSHTISSTDTKSNSTNKRKKVNPILEPNDIRGVVINKEIREEEVYEKLLERGNILSKEELFGLGS
ncbi:ATP-binding protein [Ammoniphilus sp. CFH 90114]|uniref:ATP-binding protein n=1 Tax=Ammoniphilus sp. CFH 90114 TaxID=2493665 RepID=UPI0013E9398F|nr:ATP-binding protein [Ammoniphilus sp. CFH 90114]